MPSASAAANYYSHAYNGSTHTNEPGVEADGQSDTSDEDNDDVHEVPVANHYSAPATVVRAAGVRSAAPATRAPNQQQRTTLKSAAAAQQRTTPLRAIGVGGSGSGSSAHVEFRTGNPVVMREASRSPPVRMLVGTRLFAQYSQFL